METPLISIVTATYNADKFIETLLTSVIAQKKSDIELIIIDGASKDTTVKVVKRFQQHIDYWISEPDKGIYDAWNKGVKAASGEWIMFLGADDKLKPGALDKYRNFLTDSLNLDYVSSRMEMTDAHGNLIRIKGWRWEWPSFLKMMMVAHPGSLHARKLFENYGYFDISYKISGDFELLLRPRNKLQAAFMDEVTVQMAEGGASDSVNAMKEQYRAATKTGGASSIGMALNGLNIYFKYQIKNLFRRIGFNVYLKR
jgi:glycosyltransferase involved in cell wall biosynthesis